MSKLFPTEDQEQFLEDIASLTAPWGWPRHVGRMFAYLLISEEPVTLDQLADDLCMSKSNASVAARMLEVHGNARRHSEPGSKRLYYSAPRNFSNSFAARARTLSRLMRLLEGQRAGTQPEAVNARLADMVDFCGRMRDAMLGVIESSRGDA